MAAQGYISHTNGPTLDLACGLGNNAGENVGYTSAGINDAQLNTMFMNSPGHRANILNPAYHYDIDVDRFEAGVREARAKASRGDGAGALASYDGVLALYRGPFLEDDYAEWTEAPRAHFESLRLQALAEAGRLHLGSGHREAGIACLGTLVEGEPLNEEASVLLMTSFGNSGNRAAVEKEFARLCRALKKELSSEPLPETRRAYLEALSPRRAAGRAKKAEPQSGRMGVVISIARAKRGIIP